MMSITIDYLRKHILELPNTIFNKAIAIYVYGSVARNDADDNSDCDLLICIEDCELEEFFELKEAIGDFDKQVYEFAFYQLSTLREMHKKGSYFLWHIKKEAILLYQKDQRFQSLLDTLPKYTGTKDDFDEYYEILLDVEESLAQDATTIEYDLSVLATLARNICIGCCYLLGDADFGRITPVIKCSDYWKGQFPFSVAEYNELYDYRLAFVRQKPLYKETASVCFARIWTKKLKRLLELAGSL